jgi:hypothetical protein
MALTEQEYDQPVPTPVPTPTEIEAGIRWRLVVLATVVAVAVVVVVAWVFNGSAVDRWLAAHAGTDDLSGSWYGFWSGIGSDLAELTLIGAVGTGVYHVVKKYNCHEPRCWRVGTHPAAGGQFILCYRHHPDFHGKRPTHELMEQLHREHQDHVAALHTKVQEIHQRVTAPSDAPGPDGAPAPAAPALE